MKKLLLLSLLAFALFTNIAHAQWVQTNGPFGAYVLSLASNGSNLYTGTYTAGAFRSDNDGLKWTPSNNGLVGTTINSLAARGSMVYAGTDKGIGISTDYGATWKSSLSNKVITTILMSDTNIFVASTIGITFSKDGILWKEVSTGLENHVINTLEELDTILFAGTNGNGVFRSTNYGNEWIAVNEGLIPNQKVYRLRAFGSNLYAGTDAGAYLSIDNGTSWTSINYGDLTDFAEVYDFAMVGSTVFAAGGNAGMFVSTDNGGNWTAVNNGIQARDVQTLEVNGDKLIAGTSLGVYISIDSGTSWKEFSEGIMSGAGQAFVVKGNELYAATENHLFRTSDNGDTWTRLSDVGGEYDSYFNAMMFHGPDLFVADAYNGVYRSSDNGKSWDAASDGLLDKRGWSLGQMGDNIFVGSWQKYVHRSVDKGTSWEYVSDGLSGGGATSFATIGDNLFVSIGSGNGNGGVFISKDTGTTWEPAVDGMPRNVSKIVLIGTNLYAGTRYGGVFTSTNNGLNWRSASNGLSNIAVSNLVAFGANLLAQTEAGIFFSNDGGTNWINANQGLPANATWCYAMIHSSDYIFVGNEYGFWKRHIGEFESLTVDNSSDISIRSFDISPNPTTGLITLRGLPEDTQSIKVMNILGEQMMMVKTPTGSHHTLNLTQLAAGTYYIQIASKNSVQTRMIVKQ